MQLEERERVNDAGGNYSSHANTNSNPNLGIQTRSGRVSRPPTRLIEEIGENGLAGMDITATELLFPLSTQNVNTPNAK